MSFKGRLKEESGFGGIDDSKGIGFKLHPSLVVDAQSCFPLGFSSIGQIEMPENIKDCLLRKKSLTNGLKRANKANKPFARQRQL